MSFRLLPYPLMSTALLAAAVLVVPPAGAQETAFDAAEARTALKAALTQNESLQEQLAVEKSANHAMAVKVGILSSEASTLREELVQLRQRAEATGSTGDTRGLEQRVLDALNDLRLTRTDKLEAERRLQQLAEAASASLRSTPETEASLRTSLEGALSSAAQPVSVPELPLSSAGIESSRVVSVKPEQRLLIVNAGQRAGIKAGTPLRIYRNDRPLASAVVVEVRPSVSGSLVTTLEGDEFPQVGDTLRLLSETN